jgi:hypothetical protein
MFIGFLSSGRTCKNNLYSLFLTGKISYEDYQETVHLGKFLKKPERSLLDRLLSAGYDMEKK